MRTNPLTFVPLLGSLALAQDNPDDDTRPFKPTVSSLAMIGTGCPLGAGGLIRETRDGTPVFVFPEWNLSVPVEATVPELPAEDTPSEDLPAISEPEAAYEAMKYCIEEIGLANGPPGYQVRISGMSVEGWAELEGDTVVDMIVETVLGDFEAGTGAVTVTSEDLDEEGFFHVNMPTSPDIWSACVGEDGVVPTIEMTTLLTLRGSEEAGGVVGSDKGMADLERAVALHFESVWREC